jgi:hypothetical protein
MFRVCRRRYRFGGGVSDIDVEDLNLKAIP